MALTKAALKMSVFTPVPIIVDFKLKLNFVENISPTVFKAI